MAEITQDPTASLASTTPAPENRISGLLAGADIAAGMPCYVNADGRAYPATGAAANAAASVVGFTVKRAYSGEAVTLYRNVRIHYTHALNPGVPLYLSGTVAGGLADAASTGGTDPIAFALPGNRLQIGSLF